MSIVKRSLRFGLSGLLLFSGITVCLYFAMWMLETFAKWQIPLDNSLRIFMSMILAVILMYSVEGALSKG